MQLEIINTADQAEMYMQEAQKRGQNKSLLWERLVIQPYWERISQWAPVDLSFMKPKAIKNIDKLETQIRILKQLDLQQLRDQFSSITDSLPKPDDDPIAVAIYPLDDDNGIVKERQNGVLGACVFGNVLININPLAQDFDRWIPYVFAHEYYHSVWGHHWYVLEGGKGLESDLLEQLVNEGEADAFAMNLFPGLRPQWIQNLTEEEKQIWWSRYESLLFSKDKDVMEKFMFGDDGRNLPWCIGYTIGHIIIEEFLAQHPETSFSNLLKLSPRSILAGGNLM